MITNNPFLGLFTVPEFVLLAGAEAVDHGLCRVPVHLPTRNPSEKGLLSYTIYLFISLPIYVSILTSIFLSIYMYIYICPVPHGIHLKRLVYCDIQFLNLFIYLFIYILLSINFSLRL